MDKTTERIKADADNHDNILRSNDYRIGFKYGYIAGAMVEVNNTQKLIEALQQIINAPIPANEREYISWFVAAKNVAGGAISAYEAENEVRQWNGTGKEPVKEIEYMPIHPEDASKFDCPTQVPMHLLNEEQAQRNHGQSLKRLKERGGLSVKEILAIVDKKNWSHYRDLQWKEAIGMLNDLLTNPTK